MDAKTLFLATRPWSFSMTFSSVTVGTLVAYLAVGKVSLPFYLIVLGGMIAFHAATNLINDYYDVKHNVDRMGAPTTKYRPHPVAAGAEPASTIRNWSAAFYGLTLLAALYLSTVTGWVVLALAAMGVVGSFLYTADPVVLKGKGLGEVTVFLMWGPLVPLGAYYVQTSTLSVVPVLVSLPVGFLVAEVLLANNIRDIEYDGGVGMRTVPVIFGKAGGVGLYKALLVASYAFVPVAILAGVLPVWSLAVFLTAPEARGLARMFGAVVPDNADPRTAGLALKYSLLYMASMALQALVSKIVL